MYSSADTPVPALCDAPPPRPPSPGAWRALLLSDTHGRLPAAVAAWMGAVDLVLHAGDVEDTETWAEMEALAPRVIGVRGNCDQSPLWERLPEAAVVRLPFGAAALCHGHLIPAPPARRHAALVEEFDGIPGLALVAYGHSHRPAFERPIAGGPLVVNPGSASQPRGLPSGSVVLLEAVQGEATGGGADAAVAAAPGLWMAAAEGWRWRCTFVRVPRGPGAPARDH